MTSHIYSAVRYDQVGRPEPWQEPTGWRRLVWKLRGSKKPREPFNYYDSLQLAFCSVVHRLEEEGAGPVVGTIRVLSDYDLTYLTDRVVVDFELDGDTNWVQAPAIPRALAVAR